MSNKNDKDIFLDIKKQINHLKDDRNLIISDEAKLTEYLKKYNYELVVNNMINNSIIQTHDHKSYKFINNFTSCGLLTIFDFDRAICPLFLKELLEIERRISTAIVYIIPKYFTEKNKNSWSKKPYIKELLNGKILCIDENSPKWLCIFCENRSLKDKDKVTHKLLKKYNSYYDSNNNEIPVFNGYSNIKDVPIWKLSTNWTFKTIINIFSAIHSNLKRKIIRFVLGNNTTITNEEFLEIIKIFNKLRNRVCHNNSVYNAVFSDDKDIVKKFLKNNGIEMQNKNDIVLKNVINLIIFFNPDSKINDEIISCMEFYKKSLKFKEEELIEKLDLKKIKDSIKFISSVSVSFNKKKTS